MGMMQGVSQLWGMLLSGTITFQKKIAPKKLVVGVCSFYLTMVYPMLKTSYLEPVDRGVCFAGEIPELMDFGGINVTAAKAKLQSVFDSVTDENAYKKAFEVINEAGYYMGRAHNANLTSQLSNLNETGLPNDIWDVFDMDKQLPFPYGLGNITEALNVTVEEIIFNYTNTPITVMQTSVDTNPQGGVTKPRYTYKLDDIDDDTTRAQVAAGYDDDDPKLYYDPYTCHDAPGLLNNVFSIPQGPYRLARNTNFFYSGKYYQQYLRNKTPWSKNHIKEKLEPDAVLYDWDYVVCPGVGHNSIGEAHCLGAYLSVFDNRTETTNAMANDDFDATLYYNMSSSFSLQRYGEPEICLGGFHGNDTSDGSVILYDDDIEAIDNYIDEGYFPVN